MRVHDESMTSMYERYQRAAQCSPVKIAARTAANSLTGYWLDESHYFFVAEHFDSEIDRVVATPSVASISTGDIRPVMPLEALRSLLAEHHPTAVSLASLASATFDLPAVDRLEVSLDDCIYHIRPSQHLVIHSQKKQTVPELYSPDGAFAAFLNGNDLWIRDRHSGVTRPLTTDGAPANAYGRQSEASLRPIAYRRRPLPMALWSPDSRWLLTHQTDERLVPELPLVQHVPPDRTRPVLHSYKFPMPGDPRPILTFKAIHVESGRTVAASSFPALLKLFSPFSENRVWFAVDSSAFYFLRSNEVQSLQELIEVDLTRGEARLVLREAAQSGYIDSHASGYDPPNVRVLPDSREVIWFSERDGWGHLYLHDLDTGALKGRITQGDWLVRDLVHVDEINRRILLLVGGIEPAKEPGERSLCSVNFDGSDFRLLVGGPADLAVASDWTTLSSQMGPSVPPYRCAGASPSGGAVAATRSSIDQPTESVLIDLDSRREVRIARSESVVLSMHPPKRVEMLASDGVTRLHGALFFPQDFDERRPYPLIDFIYPGPQISWLPRTYRSKRTAVAQSLAELGFVVLMMDSRRMPLRSRQFHQPPGRGLLEPQLADHTAAIASLCERFKFIDRDHIGIFGFSGGGYAAARAMFDYPETFKVGVAVSGNHDSLRYQAAWLEKYGGPPQSDSWRLQSNIGCAGKLRGRLFLISGDMDDNVHVCHTLALADALIRENKDFDMLIVPNLSHDDILINPYVERRIWDYFVQHLRGGEPARNFHFTCSEAEIEAFYRFDER